MSTDDSRSAAERRITREVHSAALPPAEPFVDTGSRSLRAEQEAGRLVASGALDPDSVLAGEGRMPGEIVIDDRAALDAAENQKARLGAAQEGLVHIIAAYDGDLTPGDEATGSLARVETRIAEAQATEEKAQSEHKDAIVALGDKAPARATRADAEQTIRRWWFVHIVLPTVLAGALELVATANAVYVFMRLDDWVSAFVVAVSAIVALTVAPMVAGLLAASWRKLGRFSWAHLAGVVGLLMLWVGTGVSLAVIRVLTTQELRDAQASSASSLDEQAGNLGVDLSTTSSGAASNPGLEMAFWIVVLLALGAVLLVKETFWHAGEAAQRSELIFRVRLWEAQDARVAWVARRIAILNQVALQKADVQTVDGIYRAEFDKIRLRAEYEKARYRNELIIVASDPEMTSALEVRFDLGGTTVDEDPFTAGDIELPDWATGSVRPHADDREAA